MGTKTVASANALVSFGFGAAGLALPAALGSAFGIELDSIGSALARLACASYIGFGLVAWLARDLRDAAAWRAVAAGSAAAWGLSAVVVAAAIVSGLGDARGWAIVALEVAFTLAWLAVYPRSAAEVVPATASSHPQ